VRMVFSQEAEHESQWCAICSISAKLGMTSRSVDCVVTPSANNKGFHSETPAHIRLGGMMWLVLHAPVGRSGRTFSAAHMCRYGRPMSG
jgi:hypothetical protein